MKLKITKDFPFAHQGCVVVQYTAGTEIETDDKDLIDTVLTEKWATKVRGDGKASAGAGENKSLPGPGENKGDDGGTNTDPQS